jgi:hypothetical protein
LFERSAACTEEERKSFGSNFLSNGFVDAFRKQHPNVVGYTYWGYRHGGPKTNKGISPLGFQKFLTKNPFTEEHLLLLLFKVSRILKSDSTLEDNSKYTNILCIRIIAEPL